MTTTRAGEKQQSRTRHETELAGLYEEYYDRIARYAFVHIGERDDAEDIAGEVFLRAIKSLDSYREWGVPMQAWLFRIAHNVVVDYLRKKSKIRLLPLETEELANDDDPVEIAGTAIDIEKVKKAMQKLSPDQRQVIGLRFMGGLASREVAAIMNKTDGAVREMQRAAIERLRSILAVEGQSPARGENGR
jgi:RNA polymerase sigma-70 factor, ECF subfamily